jgi:hypothetical protein
MTFNMFTLLCFNMKNEHRNKALNKVGLNLWFMLTVLFRFKKRINDSTCRELFLNYFRYCYHNHHLLILLCKRGY